jgi:glycosyltransferase involved in cell wall biosynthesis
MKTPLPASTGSGKPGSAPRRVLIVDDRLRDERGHQLGFVRGMSAWLARRGSRVDVWTHRGFGTELAIPDATVTRVFDRSWAEAFVEATRRARILAVLRHNLRFLSQMRRAGGKGGPWDLVIATEATVLHLFAWRLWLLGAPRATRLLLVFIHPPWLLDYSPVDGSASPKRQAFLYRWALGSMRRDLASGRCLLAADSAAVARALRADGARRVEDVNVPIAESLRTLLDAPPPQGEGRLRVGVLGRPSRERGFDRVLAAIELWTSSHADRDGRVRFVVQWHGGSGSLDADRERLLELARRFPESVQVVEGSMDDAAYASLLTSLHAGLLACNRSDYASRASNVAMEFLCAGRPYVATSGTWIAAEMETHGAGVACGERPDEIAAAVAALARDHARHAARAWSRREAAREHFSWDRFFGLLGLAGGDRRT